MSPASIIVVTHNSRRVIAACLDACRVHAPGIPVVVVDNASPDLTADAVESWCAAHPEAAIRLLANSTNRGFAGACNQGIRHLPAACSLLLNPDAVLQTDLTAMLAVGQEPDVGAVGGRLLGPDGLDQRGFTVRRLPTFASLLGEIAGLNRLWPGNPVNRRYRCADLPLDRASDAEQPAGAFLLVRRDAWQGVGGFDEGFHPLWFEDVDFCRRLHAAGWRIRYEPRAVALHEGGHSAREVPQARRPVYWYGSLLRYASLALPRWQGRAVALAVLLAALGRAFLQLVAGQRSTQACPYTKVMRLAARYLTTRPAAGPPAWSFVAGSGPTPE